MAAKMAAENPILVYPCCQYNTIQDNRNFINRFLFKNI